MALCCKGMATLCGQYGHHCRYVKQEDWKRSLPEPTPQTMMNHNEVLGIKKRTIISRNSVGEYGKTGLSDRES